jgi:glutamate synthase (NADPH/NADH) small chain
MNKKVAIIGTGPSGMAAAQVLLDAGIKVTMYDREDRPGGILMYGIPNMKLNKKNVLKKAEVLEEKGVTFILNKNVSEEQVSNQISNEYDAVLLATGARKARDINIDGRELSNIYFALEYLTDNTKHVLDHSKLKIDASNKRVIVIGGGDTANDCVATAISQGAKYVRQLELRSKDTPRKKNSYGFDEETVRLYQKTAVKFIENDGCVCKVVTDEVEIIRDESGTNLHFKNNELEIDADLVIVAIGFLGPVEDALEAFDIIIDPKVHNASTEIFSTNKANVFICGDARRGPSLIKWAIMEGKLAANEIIKYFNSKK